MGAEWRPTPASLILLIIFGATLFSLMVSYFVFISKQLGDTGSQVARINISVDKSIANTSEYKSVQNYISIIETIMTYVAGVLTSKYAVAALIAAGIVYTVYEHSLG